MKDKVIDIVKNNKRWCLLLICFIVFIVILENVFDAEIVTFDTTIYNTISLSKTNAVTNILKIITQFGSAGFLILITILSFIVIKNKKVPICIALNLASIGALNQILKRIIQRPRPEGFKLI